MAPRPTPQPRLARFPRRVAITPNVPTGKGPPPHQSVVGEGGLEEWWRDLWVRLKQNATTAGFNLLPLRFEDLGVLPAAEYRRMTRLPLGSMSPNPDSFGEAPEELPPAGSF